MAKIVVIQQPKSGRYWIAGVDAPDQWTHDVLSATRRPAYTQLSDSLPSRLADLGCILKEFEVVTTCTDTGRTTDDLFREGVAVAEWALRKAREFPDFDDLTTAQQKALLELMLLT